MTLELNPHYGPSLRALGWVPAPRYALRRWRVLEHARTLAADQPSPRGDRGGKTLSFPPLDPPRETLLEIGCGAGVLLAEMADLGFTCDALETSPSALELVRTVHRDDPRVTVHEAPSSDWDGRFDVALSFEVLEHIEDDRGALASWRAWLRPGGHLLLSVPARMSRWGPSDVYAGHYRRYERADLKALFEDVGFAVEALECYGFPVSNLVEPLRNRVHARVLEREARGEGAPSTKAEHTARSGIQRGPEARLYRLQTSWPGVAVMRLGNWLQTLTRYRDWGTGYFVRARRVDDGAS